MPEGQRKVPVALLSKQQPTVTFCATDRPQRDPSCHKCIAVQGRHAQVAVPVGLCEAGLFQEHTVLHAAGMQEKQWRSAQSKLGC
jgi:hypothetical protein